jgi:hypothetical protein
MRGLHVCEILQIRKDEYTCNAFVVLTHLLVTCVQALTKICVCNEARISLNESSLAKCQTELHHASKTRANSLESARMKQINAKLHIDGQ